MLDFPFFNKKKSTSSGSIHYKEDDEKPSSNTDSQLLRKRLVRKLDLRIIPWAILASFASKIDRSNLQSAFTMGMDKDLDINSDAYNWASSFFFIGNTVIQIPGNMIVAKFSPQVILPATAVIWGALTCLMAVVQDYRALWAIRFLLGAAEAPLFPGTAFLIGSWYTTEELGKRVTLFSTAGTVLSGAFGGLIAGGISDTMQNVHGLPSWKWLFIIEGLIAVVIGIVGFFLLPHFPHGKNSWITPEERKFAISRIRNEGTKIVSASLNWKTVYNVVITPYAWIMAITYALIYFSRNLENFFAIILKSMGYPASFSNYMLTPLNVFAFLISVALAWSSDYFGDRVFHIIGAQTFVGIWYLILAAINRGDNPVVLVYIASYATGVTSLSGSLIFAWANEIYKNDHNTRAIVIAFINAVGLLIPNFANVKLWVVSDSPEFWIGKISSMAASFGSVLLVILIWFLHRVDFLIPKPSVDKEDQVTASTIEDEEKQANNSTSK
ncbi:major facilitator superfamily domain-containing protein [Phascolomyces articulosus]|uniref:Major facilitator superfamily domain-containing protein n=1 Tax=Phascolomyces articulosus TaxID=60185 RepID=A0AAD5K965_9FUNG|nr:major facilitator superfamily domain-containing protein [Phascolomyces articulosus]